MLDRVKADISVAQEKNHPLRDKLKQVEAERDD
jgi:hypothetical protein